MARKAPIITLEEFKEKFDKIAIIHKEKTHEYSEFKTTKTIDLDLSKVEFDWENQSDCYWKSRLENTSDRYDSGYEVLENGLPGYWMWAGGDWEYPPSFFIYWDGKKLRAYIPIEGNWVNKQFMSAYGNNDNDDDKTIPKKDFELMKQDIIKRIQII